MHVSQIYFYLQNIFCDWPCNLVGSSTICPPNKRVLMKDRKQVPGGGISQQEVLAASCPNTATLSIPYMVSNGWQIDKFQQVAAAAAAAAAAANGAGNRNTQSEQQQQQQQQPPSVQQDTTIVQPESSSPPSTLVTSTGIVTSYAACSNSEDWFVSPRIITCSNENRMRIMPICFYQNTTLADGLYLFVNPE